MPVGPLVLRGGVAHGDGLGAHALAVAGMVLAQRMHVQCIKRLLLAGIEAAVESACGFVTLLGFCRALCAHFFAPGPNVRGWSACASLREVLGAQPVVQAWWL